MHKCTTATLLISNQSENKLAYNIFTFVPTHVPNIVEICATVLTRGSVKHRLGVRHRPAELRLKRVVYMMPARIMHLPILVMPSWLHHSPDGSDTLRPPTGQRYTIKSSLGSRCSSVVAPLSPGQSAGPYSLTPPVRVKCIPPYFPSMKSGDAMGDVSTCWLMAVVHRVYGKW